MQTSPSSFLPVSQIASTSWLQTVLMSNTYGKTFCKIPKSFRSGSRFLSCILVDMNFQLVLTVIRKSQQDELRINKLVGHINQGWTGELLIKSLWNNNRNTEDDADFTEIWKMWPERGTQARFSSQQQWCLCVYSPLCLSIFSLTSHMHIVFFKVFPQAHTDVKVVLRPSVKSSQWNSRNVRGTGNNNKENSIQKKTKTHQSVHLPSEELYFSQENGKIITIAKVS